MSTFCGRFEEIPQISVDRFDNYNFESEAYFLSHCHVDHMVGLNTVEFQEILIERNRFLYVSAVTHAILKRMFPDIQNQIKVLDSFSSTSIHLKKYSLSVTPIPAGHCPGSVMFLFEAGKTVLYTADYRINPNDLRKINGFYNSMKQLKQVDKIYLDTTFFFKSYLKFPTRDDSLKQICQLIDEWISKSENHLIHIDTSARYGYEFLFMEIYKRLKIPIHVNEEVYKLYSLIPEMDNSVTREGSITQIHSACGTHYKLICKPIYKLVRVIHVSAWKWRNYHLEDRIFNESPPGKFHVCYSTHASYEEGVGLLRFFKPKEVEPSVLRPDPMQNSEIYSAIQEILDEFNEAVPIPQVKKPKLFEICETESNLEQEQLDVGFTSDILDSPPRKYI